MKNNRKVNSTIKQDDLRNLVKGACFMASAGGGTYTSGMNLANNFRISKYYKSDELEVVKIGDLDDNKNGVMIAYIGSPKNMEVMEYPVGIVSAIEELKCKYQMEISYIVSPEIGAISMLAACTTAAHLGIPVVDGDGSGRAVPELSMTTFSLYSTCPTPVALGSENGDVMIIDLKGEIQTANTVEEIVRPVLALDCFEEKAGLAMWVLPGKELKKIIKSKDSISNCIEMGRLIAQNDLYGLYDKVRKIGYRPVEVASGSNIRISLQAGGGFDNGTIHFTDSDSEKGEISVVFKNESLIAWSEQKTSPLIVAPDLISYLISFGEETPQWVYSNTDLAMMNPKDLKGGSIRLISMKAPKWMWVVEDERRKLRLEQLLSAASGSSSVQQSYQNVLQSIGYYGKVCR